MKIKQTNKHIFTMSSIGVGGGLVGLGLGNVVGGGGDGRGD